MIIRALPFLSVVVGAAACDEPSDPCDRFIDYICACHDGDGGVSCADLEATYGAADPDVQDECAVLLSDQQGADNDNGVECDV